MASMLDSIKKHLPKDHSRLSSLQTECFQLNDYDMGTIKKKFCRNFVDRDVTCTKVMRVESGHLLGLYLLKKAEYGEDVREMDLWHTTSEVNALQIVKTNLDWRRAERVKFGKGVSFSPSAYYANGECNRATPTNRVAILCKVLVGKTDDGSCCTELPPDGADTTVGNRSRVYVKYHDNEFCPEYLVYYDSPGRW